MMTPRKEKSGRTEVSTKTSLTALEEKVLRMRRGLKAPTSLALEQVGQGHPEVAAKLKAIEERALAMVSARSNPAKRRIVSALRRQER
ncbi:MAG: hypothetical protein HYZ27_06715 [Deltaproteobacteria bacterium]|nr:hypothetical protein [Deltaproteobacteria bacterium]